jgi:hypothetical protein
MIAVVMFAANAQSGFRRWLRFNLRTFLLLVTVLCVWLGVKVNHARRQKEAVEALRTLGFRVYYEHWRTGDGSFDLSKTLEVPTWLLSLAGDDFFQRVVSVEVGPASIDEDLVHLAALPHIESLHVSGRGNAVSDAGLSHLPRPDRLVHFAGVKSSVGDAFVTRLAHAKLLMLELSGTRVTDKGLQALPRLPELQQLDLGNTRIGDKGLATALRDTSSLVALFLPGTEVTDESLALLKMQSDLRC